MGWNEGWWERWSVSMSPYAAGMVGISKRNFHLGQISPMPQDVVQGWAEWQKLTHTHTQTTTGRGITAAWRQKTNRKLNSYENWQKYDILINHPMVQAAGWWWCNFVNFIYIRSSHFLRWKRSKYFCTVALNGAKVTDNNNIKLMTFEYVESSILTFKNNTWHLFHCARCV